MRIRLKGLDPSNRENVTILIDQHIMIDVADIYVDNLYVEGTLELDQSTGSGLFSKFDLPMTMAMVFFKAIYRFISFENEKQHLISRQIIFLSTLVMEELLILKPLNSFSNKKTLPENGDLPILEIYQNGNLVDSLLVPRVRQLLVIKQ